MATYVVGDVHGCYETLKFLIEEKIGLSKTDNLYLLGDYIDRGPRSCETVDYLINLFEKGYQVFPIRGNHEQMLLDSINDLYAFKLWKMNAGDVTLHSYSIVLGNSFSFPNGIPSSHIDFFNSLPEFKVISDRYILVHGAINYAASDPFADKETMLWSRSTPAPDYFMPNKVILYGHTPVPIDTIQRIIETPSARTIPLDAGCVYKTIGLGNLAALELETQKLLWVNRIDEGFCR